MAAKRPLLLYTAGTPNGHKASVLLEELKAAYGVEYDAERIDLRNNVQKEPWFIALNPNGRIPVLIDRTRAPPASNPTAEGFSVFESAAILLYLCQHYDKENKFWWRAEQHPEYQSEMLQWIFWNHGGLGPMQGQANHFNKFAPEDIPYAKTRYINETKRLYGVLQLRLQDRDWLVGPGRGQYSIADINASCLVKSHAFAGIETLDEWPAVKSWVARAKERPAFQQGISVP